MLLKGLMLVAEQNQELKVASVTVVICFCE